MGYDIIGDVHGHADKLEALLKKMGYRQRSGCWRHPTQKALFLGDFVDRGPAQVRSVEIPRRMLAEKTALAIMGNHEFNAIAWHTLHPNGSGEYLRPHGGTVGRKNRKQHEQFLAEVEHNPALHADIIGWFKTLPLWLDLPGIRVVHACWHQRFMTWLSRKPVPRYLLPDKLLGWATREPRSEATKDTPRPSVFKAAEALTKGIEIPLPKGYSFRDKDGFERHRVRVRWWDREADTYRRSAIVPDHLRDQLPDLAIPEHARILVPTDKPIFFGHYWLTGTPTLLGASVACLDYSAGNGGPLVAYRWDGEANLSETRFVRAG